MNPDNPTPVWPSDPVQELSAAMAGLAQGAPAGNPVLGSQIVSCCRWRGDWLASLIAPSCIRLLLLPGGGELWGDIPIGQQRYISLAGHDWKFVAADAERIGAFQYCDLVPSTDGLSHTDEARRVVQDALLTLGVPFAPPPAADEPKAVSRRGFLRLLGGRR